MCSCKDAREANETVIEDHDAATTRTTTQATDAPVCSFPKKKKKELRMMWQ